MLAACLPWMLAVVSTATGPDAARPTLVPQIHCGLCMLRYTSNGERILAVGHSGVAVFDASNGLVIASRLVFLGGDYADATTDGRTVTAGLATAVGDVLDGTYRLPDLSPTNEEPKVWCPPAFPSPGFETADWPIWHYSPSGRKVIHAGPSGAVLYTPTRDARAQIAAVFRPSGETLVGAGFNARNQPLAICADQKRHRVLARDLATRRPLWTKQYRSYQSLPTIAVFDPESTAIALISQRRKWADVVVCDSVSGTELFSAAVGDWPVKAKLIPTFGAPKPVDVWRSAGVALSPGGRRIAFGQDRLLCYDIANHELAWRSKAADVLEATKAFRDWISFGRHARLFMSRGVRFDLHDLRVLGWRPAEIKRVCADRLHGTTAGPRMQVFDLVQGQPVRSLKALAADVAGDVIATLEPDGRLVLYQGQDKRVLGSLPADSYFGYSGALVALSPTSKCIAAMPYVLDEGEHLLFLFTYDGTLVARVKQMMALVRPATLRFSPSGRWVGMGTELYGESVYIFDVNAKALFRHFEQPHSVAFTIGDVVCLGDFHRVDILRLPALEKIASIACNWWGHYDPPLLDVSPDGRIVAAPDAPLIGFWRLRDGKRLASLMVIGSDHLLFTPQGYYSCTRPSLAAWRVSGRAYPLQAYARRFHRPDVLRTTLLAP